MKTNTTELLSIIVKSMSGENIETTDIKIYPEAVDINNKVKVCIADNSYIVHKVDERGGKRYWYTSDMIDEVLELLKPTITKPTIAKGDYVTDGEQSGVIIKVEEDEYHVVSTKNNETIYYHPNSLEEIVNRGWRKDT